MHMIAVLALSISGLVGQAQDVTPADPGQAADRCDAIRVRMYRPGMTPAEQNRMLDAISACHAEDDAKREAAKAAQPKDKGVRLWD